ncbi:MAG: hypothetical protein QXV69_09305 [Sulfolobaceae archaeon]
MGKSYFIISADCIEKIDEVLQKVSDSELILTPYSISYALSKGIDIDNILEKKRIRVRAYSHKPPKIQGIEDYYAEALMVALDLGGILVTEDEKVINKARELGVITKKPSEL